MDRSVGGRYELGAVIGSGGFGTVFHARDRRSNIDVALKLVPAGLGSEAAGKRLEREAVVLRQVSSRRVARVLDFGKDASGVWLVTELVDGAPLTVRTLGRPLLPHEALRVARGLLDGLAAVHKAGLVHGDVKPSNVLVPRGESALDGAKLVDFGLARFIARAEIATALGDPNHGPPGTILGTAPYMAPEVLSGAEPTPRSDLYGAGLVLFELLGIGPLFADGLKARLTADPQLVDRVSEPLSDVLGRMLARDPEARWPDAIAAHAAVLDLDTAPVSVVSRLSVPPRPPSSMAPRPPSMAPRSSMASRPSSIVPPLPGGRTPRTPPRSSVPPSSVGAPDSRLTSLPADAVVALRETLRHLDMPMLDALARRERGNPLGRIARAVALALRLELDAAALILEPLAMQNDVARAIGAAVLSPRARRITRARVDGDREDRWVESIDAELAGMLVALAAALSTVEDAARDADRCVRALARLDAESAKGGMPLTVDATRTTLRIAHAGARVRRGELSPGVALDLVAPLLAPYAADARGESPFHVVVRALAAAVLEGPNVDAGVLSARRLERAERVAAETGTTLLDACSSTALGMLLSSQSPHDDRGLIALERAGTLLARSDAPSLEHEAEQHRATVLVGRGRWADAIVHLRAAREAAHGERAGDRELLSTSLEVLAELAVGDLKAAYESASVLGDARLSTAQGRTAALAWVARALAALSAADREGAEDALAEAEARVREADRENADIYILVEIVGMLFDTARGALPDLAGPAASLERFAEEQGFENFYWFDLLTAIVVRMPDDVPASKMRGALGRLAPVLGPESRLARSRRTDAPPA